MLSRWQLDVCPVPRRRGNSGKSWTPPGNLGLLFYSGGSLQPPLLKWDSAATTAQEKAGNSIIDHSITDSAMHLPKELVTVNPSILLGVPLFKRQVQILIF